MRRRQSERMFIDANGCPTQIVTSGGIGVEVHYDDLPESDITTVNGLRCTTPVRTLIDIAATISVDELDGIVAEMLDRELTTTDEIAARIRQPDMQARPGALILRRRIFG